MNRRGGSRRPTAPPVPDVAERLHAPPPRPTGKTPSREASAPALPATAPAGGETTIPAAPARPIAGAPVNGRQSLLMMRRKPRRLGPGRRDGDRSRRCGRDHSDDAVGTRCMQDGTRCMQDGTLCAQDGTRACRHWKASHDGSIAPPRRGTEIQFGRLHAHRTVPWYGTQSHPLEFRRFRSATVPRYGTQALGGHCCGSVPYHTCRADEVRRNRPPRHAARHRAMASIIMRHRPPPRYDVRRHATAPTITRRRSPLHGTIRHRAATSHNDVHHHAAASATAPRHPSPHDDGARTCVPPRQQCRMRHMPVDTLDTGPVPGW